MSNILSVSEFLNIFKNEIEGNFANVSIEGEITNWSVSSSGHIYFSLSDSQALINCALFKGDLLRLPATAKKFKNGDKVICTGPLSVYLKRGSFQLIVKSIKAAGVGDLLSNFNDLKEKLHREGLFEPATKKEMPCVPVNIAIITAETGSVLQDFINVFSRRAFGMNLLLYPCLVQGANAAGEIIKAIDRVERQASKESIDVLVLARGGGSLEDLWAFNDEALARRIHSCKLPVISAIGHQTDFTISDFVADLRAETPTAAAEILSQKQINFINELSSAFTRIELVSLQAIQNTAKVIESFRPELLLGRILDGLKKIEKRMAQLTIFKHPESSLKLYEKLAEIDDLFNCIDKGIDQKLELSRHKLSNLGSVISATNPKKVLERGYVMLESKNSIVSDFNSFNELQQMDRIKISFHDGVGHVHKV